MKQINALPPYGLFLLAISMATYMVPVRADDALGDTARIAGPTEFRVALTDLPRKVRGVETTDAQTSYVSFAHF